MIDRRHVKETIHETSVECIMTATDRLCSSSGNTVEMVRQARLLGQATAQLIQNIKVQLLQFEHTRADIDSCILNRWKPKSNLILRLKDGY